MLIFGNLLYGGGGAQGEDKITTNSNSNRRIILITLKRTGKYGFPGTDGSRWANYKQHVLNTHPLISICYAHEEVSSGKRSEPY